MLISGFWPERSAAPTHQRPVEHRPLTHTARTRFAPTAVCQRLSVSRTNEGRRLDIAGFATFIAVSGNGIGAFEAKRVCAVGAWGRFSTAG